ncbi:MAG: ATP-binding protein [Gammaproteobacteria bacterium]
MSDNVLYITLDNTTSLNAALNDPHGFVHHQQALMVIDEIQRAPILLTAIKQEVDEHQVVGRFLLTGSANIQSLPGVNESLAGRVSKIRLRPLTQGELHKTSPHWTANVLAQQFDNYRSVCATHPANKDDYLLLALGGGYPEALRLQDINKQRRWHIDYVTAILERDLQDILNIKRKDSLRQLLDGLAAWSGKFMDVAAIGSNLGLSRPTLQSYLNALETLYLVERVPAWHNTDYGRLAKRDKLFMTDTGLMSALLKWQLDNIKLNGELNGKLLETFVFNQLAAILEAQPTEHRLYHYRDREQREVDFIIENAEGDLIGVEVKAGSAINQNSFKHLHWFKNNIIKHQNFIGIVLYTGQYVVRFGENMWALPIQTLWC